MAGHNKWSKIKHKKGAADAKKSKVWTKIIREITVATKMGGADAGSNPRLRKALDEARSANITKDTIQRALTRGSSTDNTEDFEELTYEGYGPSGVALLVDCLTDNRNRTSGEVRAAFNKNGGNLGTTGSVSFGFKKQGVFVFDKSAHKGLSEDKLMEVGLEFGLEDIQEDSESFTASCAPEHFMALSDKFESAGLSPDSSELAQVADTRVLVRGDSAKTLLKLINFLEDLDDVQNVWSNADFDDDELRALTEG